LGTIFCRRKVISHETFKGINKLAFNAGLPSLLFYKTATAPYVPGRVELLFTTVLAGIGAAVLTGYVTARSRRIPHNAIGTFLQASFRGNITFIGLPVILYAMTGPESHEIETRSVLLLAMVVPINLFLSVTVLQWSQHRFGLHALRKLFIAIATDPLVVATVLGFLYGLSNLPLPGPLLHTLESVGQMALPLALIGIGGTLGQTSVRGSITNAFLASVIKLLIAPLAGYFVARVLGLSGEETKIALVFLACPAAAVSFILVNQIGGDDALAASSVVLSTLFSTISLAVVLSL
jgi:predicted permease